MGRSAIHILESAADAICQHREKWDPELRDWHQRERDLRQSFFQQHRSDPALRHQVLEILDAQCGVSVLERELYFRLGLQMGIDLGRWT